MRFLLMLLCSQVLFWSGVYAERYFGNYMGLLRKDLQKPALRAKS